MQREEQPVPSTMADRSNPHPQRSPQNRAVDANIKAENLNRLALRDFECHPGSPTSSFLPHHINHYDFRFHSIETCGRDWMTNLSRRTSVCLQPSVAAQVPSGQNVLFPLALKLTLKAQIIGCLPGQDSSVLSKSRASYELPLPPESCSVVLIGCETHFICLYIQCQA